MNQNIILITAFVGYRYEESDFSHPCVASLLLYSLWSGPIILPGICSESNEGILVGEQQPQPTEKERV